MLSDIRKENGYQMSEEYEERLSAFIDSRGARQTPALAGLERKARADNVPVIRPGTQRLIQFLLGTTKPAAILEIGTAVGYSALFMHEYAPKGCKITTIEIDAKRAEEARRNFAAFGLAQEEAGDIHLIEGDAGEVLKAMSGSFDFIFMDAAKGQYINILPEVMHLLKKGGVLLTDNVLQDGEMLESRYAVTRRNRTIHRRMHEYLDALLDDDRLRTVILGTGDGAAMSVKM